MRKSLHIAVTILALVALSSCGGASNSSSASQINVAGDWKFEITSTKFNVTTEATGKLTQSGDNISGSVNLSAGCAHTAQVTGTVQGMAFKAFLNENGQDATLTGTVSTDGSGVSGDYTTPSGGCTNGDSGTFTGTRTSN